MPSSLQHTLCKMPVLLQRVKKEEEEKKKKASIGRTEKPFFPGDTHFGLQGSGFVRAPPLRAPAPPPTVTAPPRFPRPPASPEKKGLLGALSQCAVGVPGDAPRGRRCPQGSVLCREGRAAALSGPRGLGDLDLSPPGPGSFRAPLSVRPGSRADRRRRSSTPPTQPS